MPQLRPPVWPFLSLPTWPSSISHPFMSTVVATVNAPVALLRDLANQPGLGPTFNPSLYFRPSSTCSGTQCHNSAAARHQAFSPDNLSPSEALAPLANENLADFLDNHDWTPGCGLHGLLCAALPVDTSNTPSGKAVSTFSASTTHVDAYHAPSGGLVSLAHLIPILAMDTDNTPLGGLASLDFSASV